MTIQALNFITFVLLALAICAVWLKPIHINEKIILPPWVTLFIASMVSGLLAGVLHPVAVIELGLFCGVVYLAQSSKQKSLQSIVFGLITVVFALALALHRLPGFNNPVVISSMTLSADAATFTQYANFDKGAVGLILLAFLRNRSSEFSEWGKLLKQTYPIALITTVAVLGAAISISYIKPDFKISRTTVLFLIINLFFTVMAEEAFFRGFLQSRFASSLARFRFGQLIAVLCSALLFGAAHVAGSITYMFLASLAGFGYAYAYSVTQRIEAPIIVHFTLNAAHFVGFTYPHIN